MYEQNSDKTPKKLMIELKKKILNNEINSYFVL